MIYLNFNVVHRVGSLPVELTFNDCIASGCHDASTTARLYSAHIISFRFVSEA